MGIIKDFGAVGDGQGGATTTAGGVIVLDETGNGWLASAPRSTGWIYGSEGRTAYSFNDAGEHDWE